MSILRRAARTAGRTALITAVATSTHQRVAFRQQNQWADRTAAAAAHRSAQAPPAPAPDPGAHQKAGPDFQVVIDQLRQLGELRDAGVITEAEFGAQKAKLLDAG